MKVIYGHDAEIMAWTAGNIPHVDDFGIGAALGVADDTRILAGVVFHDYQPRYRTIQVSVAAISPRWAQRSIIKEILSYPFVQLGVQKVWSAIPHTNTRAIKFNKGIGFRQEAVLGRHFGDAHAVITRMFLSDYQRLFSKRR